jgi:hypothetical protein
MQSDTGCVQVWIGYIYGSGMHIISRVSLLYYKFGLDPGRQEVQANDDGCTVIQITITVHDADHRA